MGKICSHFWISSQGFNDKVLVAVVSGAETLDKQLWGRLNYHEGIIQMSQRLLCSDFLGKWNSTLTKGFSRSLE